MQEQLITVGKKSARNKLRNVKFTKWEDDEVTRLSEKFCGGNRSEWIRFASLNFRPRKRDLILIGTDDHDEKSVPVQQPT